MSHTRIKICGLTNIEDALCAAEAGADLLGFIFYPPSPRGIDVPTATAVVRQLRQRVAAVPVLVGVFVNESAAYMQQVLNGVGLDLAQLHGKESTDTFRAMQPHAYKTFKGKEWDEAAVRWDGLLDNRRSPVAHHPDLILEADHDTLYGGTGRLADGAKAVTLASQYRLLLAGGLTPLNVAEVVRRVQPWGVDVASGTEISQGMKDHAKIRQFIDAVRNA